MNRIIGLIDGLVSYIGERLNPIMVLELRRQFNLVKKGTSFAIMYGIIGLLLAFVLLLPAGFIDSLAATDVSGFLLVFALLIQYFFGVTAIQVFVVFLAYFYRWRDPLILSALSDVVLYRGLHQIGLFYTVKSFCLFYFWVVSLYLLGLISFDIFAIFPVIWLCSLTLGNMLFSFFAIFRKKHAIFFHSAMTIMLLVFTYVVISTQFSPVLPSLILTKSKELNFINTWNWLPLLIIAFPVCYYVTLKVINFNLTSNKSNLKKLLISITIYSILIIIILKILFALI
ncbi:MAG: hypothetical protein LBL39_03115 [Planctomycetaceae bacterium]|jgi:hypothetical protein|nr:hypothetical protein [Planctomycetaceae bacterium]